MYKYCRETLTMKKLNLFKLGMVLVSFLIFCSFTSYLIGSSAKTKYINKSYEESVIIVNDYENSNFSPQALYDYIKELNLAHPDIIFAQAVIESGHFKSVVFKNNHNLFGMKEGYRRPNTCKGVEMNHAYYDTWKESVLDYALFQASYLRSLKTEEQYLEYLDQNYAESGNYKKTIISVMKNNPYKIVK